MPMICLKCFEIYDKNSLKIDEFSDYQFCPKTSCIGELIEIDELFVPIIIELNKKGYHTKFCCSGHYYEQYSNAYITFDTDIILPNIPSGNALETNNDGSFTIRKEFGSTNNVTLNTYKYYTEILKNAEITFKWAKKLPDISD